MAPKKCPIQSCNYHHTKGFYIIPEHPVRRAAWAEACKLSPPYNKPICFRHFNLSDFLGDITDEHIAQLKFGKLKRNVVPSQNLPDDYETNVESNVKVKSSQKPLVPRACPVESCDYRSTKGYYVFPEDPVRRQAWIKACKLSPQCNMYTKICFQHFKISDFIKDITEEDIAQCRFGKLNKDVVPSQNLPGDSKTDFAFFLEPSVILKESDEVLKIKSEPCNFESSEVNPDKILSDQDFDRKLDQNNWQAKVIKSEPCDIDNSIIFPDETPSNQDFDRKLDQNDWRAKVIKVDPLELDSIEMDTPNQVLKTTVNVKTTKQCDTVSNDKRDFSRHYRHKCTDCGLKFKNESDLERHNSEIHIQMNGGENKGLKMGPVDCKETRNVYEDHGGYVIVNHLGTKKSQRTFDNCTFYGHQPPGDFENDTYINCVFYKNKEKN